MRGFVAFLWRKNAAEPFHSDVQQDWETIATECRVRLSGRITIDSSPGLRASLLRRLNSPACRVLTVDLCEVAYIDTSGLATLVEILKAARTDGKVFRLYGLRDRPRFLLESTRLLHFFSEEPPRREQAGAEDPA